MSPWDPTKPAGTDAANTIDDSVIANNNALDTWASAITDGIAQAGATIYKMYRSANATILKFRAAAADTFDRFTSDLNGYLQWGSGAGAQDVGLSRAAAGVLQLDAGNQFRVQQDPVNANDVARKSYVDGGARTLKKGSGLGDYTTASAVYVDIDATNLAYTVTIPSGQKVLIMCGFSITQNNGSGAIVNIALADGTTPLIETQARFNALNQQQMGSTPPYLFTGDGAPHTFKLRWNASVSAAVMANSTSTLTPTMVFLGA